MSRTILLLQARDPGDPILEHELNCFIERSGLPAACFTAWNMVTESLSPSILEGVDVVMVGGSGDYSVVSGGFAWHEPMLELMRTIVKRHQPMFASCFGFQALVQALGGQLARDPARAELGTFTIELTEAGRQDSLLSQAPARFDAQLGHNDSAVALPEELICLARSARCDLQAVRHRHAPIVATQFHPELNEQDNIRRYLRYIQAYKKPGESIEEARERAHEMHRPSPHANELVRAFLELH